MLNSLLVSVVVSFVLRYPPNLDKLSGGSAWQTTKISAKTPAVRVRPNRVASTAVHLAKGLEIQLSSIATVATKNVVGISSRLLRKD